MRLIDIAPFEKLGTVLRVSYTGAEGKRHTLVAPVEDIPTYGSCLSMPEYLRRAIGAGEMLPDKTKGTAKPDPCFAEQSIEELDLSVRSYNCLMRANIHTLADLLARSEAELMHIRNMGKISITEIKGKLEQMGLQLAENPEDRNTMPPAARD